MKWKNSNRGEVTSSKKLAHDKFAFGQANFLWEKSYSLLNL